LSTVTGVGLPGDAGLNVSSSPFESTTVHWLVDGHVIAVRKGSLLPMSAGVRLPGDVGSKVTSWPSPSITVHWLTDAHATPMTALKPLASTVTRLGFSAEAGLNVSSWPRESTAVH
jgi:hypothetical protein